MACDKGITLAVIVKDEADLLHNLLTSHAGIYDEAVVVDTGSEDNSYDIARQAGARVYSHSWNDDFSAARNFGLSKARYTWILVLDCDESITKRDFAQIRACINTPADMCYTFTQLNYYSEPIGSAWCPLDETIKEEAPAGAKGYIPVLTPRLIPNLSTVRYRGCIHEDIEQSARQNNLEITSTGIFVHHSGHLRSKVTLDERTQLYGRLLRKKVDQEPGNAHACYELASHLATNAQFELARRLLDEAISESPDYPGLFRHRILLGRLLINSGDTKMALANFEAAVIQKPDYLPCWTSIIEAFFRAGDLPSAQKYSTTALKLFPDSPQLQNIAAQVFGQSGR